MKTTSRLKQIVARREAVQAPGTANALFARVIEDLGFEVVYVTGAGIATVSSKICNHQIVWFDLASHLFHLVVYVLLGRILVRQRDDMI